MPILYQVLAWLGLLVAGGTGGYLVTHPEALTSAQPIPHSAWVEVISPEVKSGESLLTTGDEVSAPTTISTGPVGNAILHFPDGSTATVEPDTTFELLISSYDEESTGIIAHFFLTAGKMAFQIVELATPKSRWEVKTGNAVAVVRGTAFSVWFEDGTSSIAVTDDTVSVTTLNPETGEPVAGTEVMVTENKTAKVTAEAAQKGEAPSVLETPKEKTSETPPQADTSPRPAPVSTQPAPPAANPAPTPAPSVSPAPSPTGSPKVTASKLTVEGTTRGVTDGDVVTFKAIVTMSDGTRRDVTSEATWQVLGPIGTMRSSGVFSANLDASTSEYGKGSGAVVATWKDPASGTELLGQTAIFEVRGYVPQDVERSG